MRDTRPIGLDAVLVDLYDRHHHEILAYCIRRIGHTDADDVTADVFATAWRRRDEIELATARAWLFGVARGVLANRWRSTKRRARLIDRVSGLGRPHIDSPDVVVVRKVVDEAVIEALNALRPGDREILMLAAWEELTAPEIAVVLDISTSAAEQRIHRAKKRLAKRLTPQPDDGHEARGDR